MEAVGSVRLYLVLWETSLFLCLPLTQFIIITWSGRPFSASPALAWWSELLRQFRLKTMMSTTKSCRWVMYQRMSVGGFNKSNDRFGAIGEKYGFAHGGPPAQARRRKICSVRGTGREWNVRSNTGVEQTEGRGRRQLIPEKSQQEHLNLKFLKLKQFLHPKKRRGKGKGKGFLKQFLCCVLQLAATTRALILYLDKSFPPLLGWGHPQSLYFIAADMWATQESSASSGPSKQGYSMRALRHPNPLSGTGHFEHFSSDLPFVLTSFPSEGIFFLLFFSPKDTAQSRNSLLLVLHVWNPNKSNHRS